MRSPMSSRGAALFWGSLELSRPWESLEKIYKKTLSRWLVNQHWARWGGLDVTQREARKLITVPSVGAKAKILSFNRTQSSAVTDLPSAHNTPRRHLHPLGLLGSPLCGMCGVKGKISKHIFCEYEVLAYSDKRIWASCFWSQRTLRT